MELIHQFEAPQMFRKLKHRLLNHHVEGERRRRRANLTPVSYKPVACHQCPEMSTEVERRLSLMNRRNLIRELWPPLQIHHSELAHLLRTNSGDMHYLHPSTHLAETCSKMRTHPQRIHWVRTLVKDWKQSAHHAKVEDKRRWGRSCGMQIYLLRQFTVEVLVTTLPNNTECCITPSAHAYNVDTQQYNLIQWRQTKHFP